MKKIKKTSLAISIVIVVFCLVLTALFFRRNGKEQYDVVFFGDSIVAGGHNDTSLPAVLEKLSGLRVLNAGFGGLTMSRLRLRDVTGNFYDEFTMAALSEGVRDRNFSLQLMASQKGNEAAMYYWNPTAEALFDVDWNSVKYVIVEQCINDYLLGRAVDNPDDRYDEDTFGGALRYTIENIKKGAPKVKIIIQTPTFIFPDGMEGDCVTADYGGGVLTDYIAKEYEIAEEYSLTVVDNFETSGITADNYKDYLGDGLHGNSEATGILAANIYEGIKEADEFTKGISE